jgi:hypothetical protein
MPIVVTNEEFQLRSIRAHPEGSGVSRPRMVYVNAKTPVCITCDVHNEDFYQLPSKHIAGQGCPKCKGAKLRLAFVSSKEVFVSKAELKHPGLNTYDLVEYVNSKTKVKILCLNHNTYYLKTPEKHLSGQGCPSCAIESTPQCVSRPLPLTLELAYALGLNNIDYSKVTEVTCKDKVVLTCSIHGDFLTTMDNHLNAGSSCPKCSHIVSKAQISLFKYIQSIKPDAVENKKLLDNTELDVFIPSLNLGFEYNGLYWHGEGKKDKGYHLRKTNQAESEGIRLVHIWEDEWQSNRSKVENLIASLTGLCKTTCGARECVTQAISWKVCSEFLQQNHLQGECAPTSMCYGLLKNSEVISVMCFTTSTVKNNEVELIRFCSSGNVPGGFSKLLKYFLSITNFDSVISFSDKRWSQGAIYSSRGFIKVGNTDPAYSWCKGMVRYHRRGFQHKYLASKLKVYDPNMSESKNCRANGYFKLWDCGKDKWELKITLP